MMIMMSRPKPSGWQHFVTWEVTAMYLWCSVSIPCLWESLSQKETWSSGCYKPGSGNSVCFEGCPHIKTIIHCIQKPIETWIFASTVWSMVCFAMVCSAFQRPQKRVPIGLFFWNLTRFMGPWIPWNRPRHAEWAECPMEAVQKLETWRQPFFLMRWDLW